MPDGGRLHINGQDATYAAPHERDIGMVFQNYALFPHMTVAENIAFPLKMRRIDNATAARRAMEALELVRLPQLGSVESLNVSVATGMLLYEAVRQRQPA